MNFYSHSEALSDVFRDPPAEYGPVDGWWWEAGRLDRERLRWQLEQFKEKGIAGTWFYARYLYDEPLASDPRYFSDEWWEFTRFAAEEQKRLGLRNFFSVWTVLEFEQDALRAQRADAPELWGRRLVIHSRDSKADEILQLEPPETDEILDAAAYRVADGAIDLDSRVDLNESVGGRRVQFEAPDAGWMLAVIAARRWDLAYLSPEIGERWTDVILGEYERRLAGLLGSGVEGFGPDEMTLLNGVVMFSLELLERAHTRLGTDPKPYLIGLFHDIGAATERIRCNYHDAACELLEERFYAAPTSWLHGRGMKHASISQLGGSPVAQTFHYGDFFRYLRSFDIPGNEDPGTGEPGSRMLFHNKMSSSVSRLYGSGRAVVLSHYCSGWGHTLEENLAWTNESYANGMNFYSRHLGSYSLMAGWYEYVPPSDHFYHPYWRYWKHFADYVRRLSFVMAQGSHRADAAVLYPVSTLHAHWVAGVEPPDPATAAERETAESPDAETASRDLEATFEAMDADLLDGLSSAFGPAAHEASAGVEALAQALYRGGADFDFVDNDALARATVSDGVLTIGDLEFRSLILPPMTTIPIGVAELMKRFHDAGGTVGVLGRLPYASVESGREDPELRRLLDGVFADADRDNARGFIVADDATEVPRKLFASIVPDLAVSEGEVFHTHQHVDGVDLYLLFNPEERERTLTVSLRVEAEVERWDPFTGTTEALHRVRRRRHVTEVDLSIGVYEAVVLVCDPGGSRPSVVEDELTELVGVSEADGAVVVRGFSGDAGVKRVRVAHRGTDYLGEAEAGPPPEPISVDEPWSFRLEPTMDNRWGDFRHPPSETTIGAEARKFRYRTEPEEGGAAGGWHRPELDDSGWREVTYSHGPYWRQLGPIEAAAEPEDTLSRALRGDEALGWRPLEFSTRFGSLGQRVGWPGVEHLMGVSDNFLVLEPPGDGASGDGLHHSYLYTVVEPAEAGDHRFVFGHAPEHEMVSLPRSEPPSEPQSVSPGTKLWVNGEEIALPTERGLAEVDCTVRLRPGDNEVLLKIVQPDGARVTAYAAFLSGPVSDPDPYVPQLRLSSVLEELTYDAEAAGAPRTGWYRFEAPPGLQAIQLETDALGVEAWVEGEPIPVVDGILSLAEPRRSPSLVALRIEQKRGRYAGAAIRQPVAFTCADGLIELGDWSEQGLASYSGIGIYSTVVELSAAHLRSRPVLDLGQVKTVAELTVNGRGAGVRIGRPFRFDLSGLLREGENQIEVKVANTLANHMSSYPTQWVLPGQTVSGLLGPVTLRFATPVELVARPVGE